LEKSVVSLLVALIATAVGLYLILTASEPASATFVGGCVSASVGAISTLKLLRHVLESIRAGSFKKTSNNAPQDG
jgi:hypothetical protein